MYERAGYAFDRVHDVVSDHQIEAPAADTVALLGRLRDVPLAEGHHPIEPAPHGLASGIVDENATDVREVVFELAEARARERRKQRPRQHALTAADLENAQFPA